MIGFLVPIIIGSADFLRVLGEITTFPLGQSVLPQKKGSVCINGAVWLTTDLRFYTGLYLQGSVGVGGAYQLSDRTGLTLRIGGWGSEDGFYAPMIQGGVDERLAFAMLHLRARWALHRDRSGSYHILGLDGYLSQTIRIWGWLWPYWAAGIGIYGYHVPEAVAGDGSLQLTPGIRGLVGINIRLGPVGIGTELGAYGNPLTSARLGISIGAEF